MSKLYIVFSNSSAGQMWIEEVEENSNLTYQELGGSHADNVLECYSKEECEKYIEELEETSKEYYVFINEETKYCWIEEFDCTSGTVQERIYSYDNWRDISDIAKFNTKEEAEDYCEKENR